MGRLAPLLEHGAQIGAGLTLTFVKHFIRLRRHDEVVLVQAADLMRPPLQILVARNTKKLVHRRSVNLVVDGNTKTRLLSLGG